MFFALLRFPFEREEIEFRKNLRKLKEQLKNWNN